MNMAHPRIDDNVEILTDDQGRVLLIPRDGRNPMRLGAKDGPLIALISGDPPASGDTLSPPEQARLDTIVAALDRQGFLLGRRSAPPRGITMSARLTAVYDVAARWATRPIARLNASQVGNILFAVSMIVLAGLAGTWIASRGTSFVGLVSPYWWGALLLYLFIFPFVHEFSHALVARAFGLQVSGVGIVHKGGLSYAPFVEIRDAILTSNPTIRTWLPLAGVVCNVALALLSNAAYLAASDGSVVKGVAGAFTVLMHLRVLIDGGFGRRSDASQAVGAAREFGGRRTGDATRLAIRGGWMLFAAAFATMLILSIAAGLRTH